MSTIVILLPETNDFISKFGTIPLLTRLVPPPADPRLTVFEILIKSTVYDAVESPGPTVKLFVEKLGPVLLLKRLVPAPVETRVIICPDGPV